MLKEITISNFRSYNKEVTFSMEADTEHVKEYPNHYREKMNNNILRVASMYGPNGGGKSNLIKALLLAKILIKLEFNHSDPTNIKCEFSNEEVTEETLFFVDDKYEIGYKFQLVANNEEEDFYLLEKYIRPINRFKIINETVIYREKGTTEFCVLLERDSDGNVNSEMLQKININIPTLANRKSIVAKVYEEYANREEELPLSLDIIRHLFIHIKSITNLYPPKDAYFDGMRITPLELNSIEQNKDRLVQYLNEVDIKISDIKIYREGKPFMVYFERMIPTVDGQLIKKEMSFYEESEGTKKIFKILLRIINGLKKNLIFYCDDLNAYLHPKLMQVIIKIFNSNLNDCSQLIFNSHDLLSMNNELFRRDEIWFAYRDEYYATQLVPLSNIVNYKGERIRNDAKYYKQYLEGKYGSDPFIKKGLEWDE